MGSYSVVDVGELPGDGPGGSVRELRRALGARAFGWIDPAAPRRPVARDDGLELLTIAAPLDRLSGAAVVALRVAVAVGVAAIAAAALAPPAHAATVPAGFQDQSALTGAVARPVALAFTPDGRMLIASQNGTLHVAVNGVLQPLPALDLSARTCSNSERGLLGVAVDPSFSSNGLVYVYYTFDRHGSCATSGSATPVNRVSRFVMTGNAVSSAEQVLVDGIPSPAGNHNGGDVQFGTDGLLYVGVGDGGCDYAGDSGCAGLNDAARDRHTLLGKVLRINPDGGVPAGNPFVGAGTASCAPTGATAAGTTCRETFAWGLRNPFRIAFDPNAAGTRFFVNDVGQSTWEEVDEGAPGADYGWNVREGPCARGSTSSCGPPPAGMTNPVFSYAHSTGCRALVGGAFVPNGVWPAAYEGAYLFGDLVCGTIFRVPSGSPGAAPVAFAQGFEPWTLVHLAFGPSPSGPALYYTTLAGGGEVRRIVSTASPPPPPFPPPPPPPPPPSPPPPIVVPPTPVDPVVPPQPGPPPIDVPPPFQPQPIDPTPPPPPPPGGLLPPGGAPTPLRPSLALRGLAPLTRSPRTPRAGRTFSVSAKVETNDVDALVSRGILRCSAVARGRALRVAGRSLRPAAGHAVATCRWRLPKRTKGHDVRGTLRIEAAGTSLRRRFTVRVR